MEKQNVDDVVTFAAAAAAVIVIIRRRRRLRLQHRRLLWCKPWLQARDSGRMSDFDLDLRPKPKVWAGSPNVKKINYVTKLSLNEKGPSVCSKSKPKTVSHTQWRN